MSRPRGSPPTPSAMSSPSEPVETASTCIASFEPNFITEPLPKARSICAKAASSAFCLSVPFTDFPDSTSDNCPAMTVPFLLRATVDASQRPDHRVRHLFSWNKRGTELMFGGHLYRDRQKHRRVCAAAKIVTNRSEEHTSELQSLMRISYAVFCLKKKKHIKHSTIGTITIKKEQRLHINRHRTEHIIVI